MMHARLRLLEIALFVLVFSAFYLSPVQQIWDSKYSMLLSETILQRHQADLKYAQLKAADPYGASPGYPYQTVLVKRQAPVLPPMGRINSFASGRRNSERSWNFPDWGRWPIQP